MALYRPPRLHNGLDRRCTLSLPFQSHNHRKTTYKPSCYNNINNPSKDSLSLASSNIKSGQLNNFPFIISTLLCSNNAARLVGQGPPQQRSGRFATSAQSEDKAEQISWIDAYLPEKARGYARLARVEKPIGTWLLAWPFMWSLALAGEPGSLPNMGLLALFGVWSVAIRGAACTINDYFDRDFDRQVERCKNRPIASGAVTPAEGLGFYILQTLVGLGPLLYTNTYSQVLGALQMPFVVAYPLMKRITYWPQAFLGLMFNWGALLGWAVIKGSLDPAVVLPLYVSGFFWTLVYDTIYAHQDKEDDVKAGVKSTALQFGDSTKKWITGFGIASISLLALSGFNANIGSSYYAILALASAHLAWQIWTVDLSSPADCNSKFVSNTLFGAIIFSGVLLGRLLP